MPLPPDVIGLLAGLRQGSAVDEIRAARPVARTEAQRSFQALFEPADPAGVSLVERLAVATFVAGLHADPASTLFYGARLAALAEGLSDLIAVQIGRGQTQGPYGGYPDGPLAAERQDGPRFRIGEPDAAGLGPRLAAALAHAHLLVFHPRDAGPEDLRKLTDAGFDANAIVTLSQLVAFLSFQVRTIQGFRVLAA
ncbi:MAG: CMD domain protein [Telmatospirillum sp.]|nr:CMD domain protein [Telmatospirillum sp.]